MNTVSLLSNPHTHLYNRLRYVQVTVTLPVCTSRTPSPLSMRRQLFSVHSRTWSGAWVLANGRMCLACQTFVKEQHSILEVDHYRLPLRGLPPRSLLHRAYSRRAVSLLRSSPKPTSQENSNRNKVEATNQASHRCSGNRLSMAFLETTTELCEVKAMLTI